MTYGTAAALRMALEQRLLNQSNDTGVSIDRLRRRVVFERIVARLQLAEPGQWVLKGGMAIEVRLGEDARLTKDIDLGLRAEVHDPEELHDRLTDALALDPYDDRFVLRPGAITRLTEDGAGHLTWRSRVVAELAGKPFGSVQVDISPRAHELDQTEIMKLPNSLDFAGVTVPDIEVIDVHRHAAEKFHGMLKDFGDRENTRVRDLVDLVILHEHDLLEASAVADSVNAVWSERDGGAPPGRLPPLPESWPARYESLAEEYDLTAASFPQALIVVTTLWMDMFPTESS